MSTITADLRCHHCSASLAEADLAEAWCGSCGKRLPSTFKAAVQRVAPVVVAPPAPVATRWGLGLMAVGSLAIGLALAYTMMIITLQ